MNQEIELILKLAVLHKITASGRGADYAVHALTSEHAQAIKRSRSNPIPLPPSSMR